MLLLRDAYKEVRSKEQLESVALAMRGWQGAGHHDDLNYLKLRAHFKGGDQLGPYDKVKKRAPPRWATGAICKVHPPFAYAPRPCTHTLSPTCVAHPSCLAHPVIGCTC